MSKMKRILSLVLVAAMAVTVLAGCGGESDTTASSGGRKFTYWTGSSGAKWVTSYNDLVSFQKIQEDLDVEIEFIHPSSATWSEQFNIMLASGEYADIMNQNDWNTAYNGGLGQAHKDGVIIDLTEYYDGGKMPNFKKALTQDPRVEVATRTLDGKIFSTCTVKDGVEMNASCGPVVRKDWLEKLNIPIPDTMDDWYNMLVAFKTQDPNGNGKADEIPFGDLRSQMFKNLAGAYGVVARSFYLGEDGKITYGSMEPGYKDFITEMNRWYTEGLLDQEFAAIAKSAVDANVCNDIVGSFIGLLGSYMGNYLQVKADDPNFDLIGVPWPRKDANSVRYNPRNITSLGGGASGAVISTTCKNPDLAVEVLDYMYSEKATEYLNWGVEGETFTKENGEYKYTDFVLNNPDGTAPLDVIGKYAFPSLGVPVKVWSNEAYSQVQHMFPQQKEASKNWSVGDNSLTGTGFKFSAEETTEKSILLTDLQSYEDEMFTKMVMGQEPISKFDEYLENMKRLRIDDILAIYQTAHERYMSMLK